METNSKRTSRKTSFQAWDHFSPGFVLLLLKPVTLELQGPAVLRHCADDALGHSLGHIRANYRVESHKRAYYSQVKDEF